MRNVNRFAAPAGFNARVALLQNQGVFNVVEAEREIRARDSIRSVASIMRENRRNGVAA